jgi:predicted NAD/FAD-binding protein
VLTKADGEQETFDAVVLATHAEVSLELLGDASPSEREILAAFPYQPNQAVLHTDESWLPRRRAAWASWNYRLTAGSHPQVCVTYDLGRLQKISCSRRILVTLNPPRPIRADCVLQNFTYHHPVFSLASYPAQSRWQEISGVRGTYYCGAYWGHGFHEDGVVSALAVAEQWGIGLEACTARCIKARSSTAALVP